MIVIKRYEELDSLRGLAALSVLFGHFMLIVPSTNITSFIDMGPVRILVASSEAVTLFFVLSGFVLSLPFYKQGEIYYGPYVTKRFFRIFMPYYIALIVVLIASVTYSGEKTQLSDWFNGAWDSNLSIELILKHVFLLGSFPNAEFNPVLWSLVHEMRISIIFPLLMLLIIRFNWKFNIGFGVICSMVGFVLYLAFNKPFHDYFHTLHYISIFIIGAILAKHREFLISNLKSYSVKKKSIILFIGLFFYLYVKPAYAMKIIIGDRDAFLATILDSWMVTIGACIIIILSLSVERISRVLLSKPLQFLGKISYSLYLYHCIVLFTLTHLLVGKYSLWIIWPVSFFISIAVASVSYYYVEVPSIKIGKVVTAYHTKNFKKIQERKAV